MGVARDAFALGARTGRRSRLAIATASGLEAAARILIVLAARSITDADLVATSATALASAAVFGVLRMVQTIARASVQRDLHRAAVAASLESDVLEPFTDDPNRILFEGLHHGTLLVSQTIPGIVGDLVASVVVLRILWLALSLPTLGLAALAIIIALAFALAVRRLARTLEQRSADANAEAFRWLAAGFEARTEIVAEGRELTYATRFESVLEAHERSVRSTGLVAGLLGRAPIVLGALTVILALFLQRGGLRGEPTAWREALVLAACFPPLRNLLGGVATLARAGVFVAPFARLLGRPKRRDEGGTTVTLPVDVRADKLSFGYDTVPVLREMSFTWSVGEPLVLVGPNGSGKSTLLRLLVGLRPPTAGKLLFGDVESTRANLVSVRRHAAYLPQRPFLGEPHDTVRSALSLGGSEASDAELHAALTRLELRHIDLDDTIGRLSAGQRQRLAVARLLLRDARLVLLDEPDADLDREGVALVASLVRELVAAGKMVAVSAHGPELRALTTTPLELGPR